MEEFSLKELYDVRIKSTYNIEIGKRKIDPGETIALFDKLSIANFNEIQQIVSARGGFGNQGRVFWTTTQEVPFTFQQGIFSKEQFSLMTNSRLIECQEEKIEISKREIFDLELGGDQKIQLKYSPKRFFCYDGNYNRITPFYFNDQTLVFDNLLEGQRITVDYTYIYEGGYQKAVIGQELISGFCSLEGKTRVKDDVTGKTKTGIILIPKMKIMSSLSMVLGDNANPVVGTFYGTGLPVGKGNNAKVMEIIFLNDDIDADIV